MKSKAPSQTVLHTLRMFMCFANPININNINKVILQIRVSK